MAFILDCFSKAESREPAMEGVDFTRSGPPPAPRPAVIASEGIFSITFNTNDEALSEADVVWLPLAPLWWTNPRYWRQPLEFLHRLLRVHRMALLTSAPARASDPGCRGRHRRGRSGG